MKKTPPNDHAEKKTDTNTGLKPTPDQFSTPLWAKVFGALFIALVILFIVLHLTGNSPGAGSHMSSNGTEHEMQQP